MDPSHVISYIRPRKVSNQVEFDSAHLEIMATPMMTDIKTDVVYVTPVLIAIQLYNRTVVQ